MNLSLSFDTNAVRGVLKALGKQQPVWTSPKNKGLQAGKGRLNWSYCLEFEARHIQSRNQVQICNGEGD